MSWDGRRLLFLQREPQRTTSLSLSTLTRTRPLSFPPTPLSLSQTHRHQLALYFNVTGLKWDYDSPIVEGFISPADGLPPRALRVDPSALPPSSNQAVALADALWNEISTAHGTVA